MRSLTPSLLALGFLSSLALAGCPIWSDDNSTGCFGDCCDGQCPNPDSCSAQSDCGLEEVCGADNVCHVGSCTTWGCPVGSVCLTNTEGVSECIASNNGGGGGGGAGSGGGGVGGSGGGTPDPVYCGNPDDCGAGQYCAPDGTCHTGDCSQDGCIFGFLCDSTSGTPTCVSESPTACGTDADCAGFGSGYLCVSGDCTAPQDQCFDQTQCPGGDVCADGKCVADCSQNQACPGEYTCTSGIGLCTTPVSGCSITNDCGSADLVCVDGGCVPRATDGMCANGYVWVENGCIPDQSALFVCNVDGMQDVCAAGSICLHHSCYISCAAPNDQACVALPDFNECKLVTTQSGDHPVCGSATNLGNECDPTAGMACSPGLVCIDGFCN